MWIHANSLRSLLKFSLNDPGFRCITFGNLIHFANPGGTQTKKNRVKSVKPNLPFDEEDENSKTKDIKKRKRMTVNIVTPLLADARGKDIKTVLGLHLGPSNIYWARIQRCGNVTDWDHRELFPIADMSRKIQLPMLYEEVKVQVLQLPKYIVLVSYLLSSTFYRRFGRIVMKVLDSLYFLLEHIPYADAYVIEGTNQGQPNSLKSTSHSVSATTILRAQILAMLVGLLNNKGESEVPHSLEADYLHKVFLLRPRLMSRLFHLLVGSERVSALVLVDSILEGRVNSSSLSVSDVMSEPSTDEDETNERFKSSTPDDSQSSPIFTPVTVPLSIKESYRRLRAVEKEGMCQALLIAMTFYDLAVFKDPKVLKPLQL